MEDLNLQPTAYRAVALPIELISHGDRSGIRTQITCATNKRATVTPETTCENAYVLILQLYYRAGLNIQNNFYPYGAPSRSRTY